MVTILLGIGSLIDVAASEEQLPNSAQENSLDLDKQTTSICQNLLQVNIFTHLIKCREELSVRNMCEERKSSMVNSFSFDNR